MRVRNNNGANTNILFNSYEYPELSASVAAAVADRNVWPVERPAGASTRASAGDVKVGSHGRRDADKKGADKKDTNVWRVRDKNDGEIRRAIEASRPPLSVAVDVVAARAVERDADATIYNPPGDGACYYSALARALNILLGPDVGFVGSHVRCVRSPFSRPLLPPLSCPLSLPALLFPCPALPRPS
jgi:hypothetical protein